MQRLIANFRIISRLALRYALVWIADAVSIGLTALVVPGIYFIRTAPLWYLHPFIVALLFGLLNALVRPLLIILLLPITFVTLGLATLVLNAALFYLANILISSFVIESFGAAVIGVLMLSLVNTLLGNLYQLGDDYSFYATLMNKFGTMTRPREVDLHERGLVILQIDGLSYAGLKHAIQRGKTPFLGQLVKRRHYSIRRWFSGLPSQTSAVQSAVFYGSSFDIPGFRWYDKRAGRIVESSNSGDMSAVDERLSAANGDSILASGTVINSLVHGNAAKKLLTVSSLSDRDIKHHRGELEDFAIFSLHPYLYTRTIMLMAWDFFVDRIMAASDRIRGKKPKVHRGVKFSVHRAVGNACLREITTFCVREDIVRGIPIIYANYIGYDMVAHYSGPNSWDALNTLTAIDRHIKAVKRTITKHATRGYDILVLSDHGQTASIPFAQRYGESLDEMIAAHLDDRTVGTGAGPVEAGYLRALLREMAVAEKAYGTRSIRGGRRTLERLHQHITRGEGKEEVAGGVVVCPSGDLAHVYFTESNDRLTTEQLLALYPGLLEHLAAHAGIGFVLVQNDSGECLMMGSAGARNLNTASVEGIDPLPPYVRGDEDAVVASLLQLCGYPSAGDVILNGAMVEDGAIISFENQRGTHGGLGGEQTAPFILYPGRFRRKDDHIGDPQDLHRFIKRLLPS